MIEGHGDDLWRYGAGVKHNFSTNIHSSFDHRPLMAVLAEAVSAVESYPEPAPVSVERAIAETVGCAPDEVMVTNGATEAIYLAASVFAGKSSAILVPTFREYQDACKLNSHKLIFIKSLHQIPAENDVVWLCNPNNPTGKVLPHNELLKIISENRDKVFIIDQAYSDYTHLPVITPREAVDAGNVILLGSLTKRFAVPGLRIGYAIGSADLLARIRERRMPWSVNGLAIAGALYLLENISDYRIDAENLHSEALRISREFQNIGIAVEPTDCNFILCKLPAGDVKSLKDFLMEEAGILIRDASNFESLDESYFRIAAQYPEENDLLIEKIGEYIKNSGND